MKITTRRVLVFLLAIELLLINSLMPITHALGKAYSLGIVFGTIFTIIHYDEKPKWQISEEAEG